MILLPPSSTLFHFFFFNDTATTEIYTLSLHDALPISSTRRTISAALGDRVFGLRPPGRVPARFNRLQPWGLHRREGARSEEHTSELQSRLHLVCRLLLEKKKSNNYNLGYDPSHAERDVLESTA